MQMNSFRSLCEKTFVSLKETEPFFRVFQGLEFSYSSHFTPETSCWIKATRTGKWPTASTELNSYSPNWKV